MTVHFRALLSAPPYHRVSPLEAIPKREAGLAVFLDLSPECLLETSIRVAVLHLRRAVPWAPFIIRASAPASGDTMLLAAETGLKPVWPPDAELPTPRMVLAALPDPRRVYREVARLIAVLDPSLGAAQVELIQWLLAPPSQRPPHASVIGGHSPRAQRRSLARRGQPSRRRWTRLGQLLPILVRLQTDPGLTLSAAAELGGYAEASSLSRAFSACFGERPGALRRLKTWEWAFGLWARRHWGRAFREWN